MSINQKRAVLIIAGVLILVCTYFFLYQPNTDKVMQIEIETSKLNREASFLSTLQIQVNEMKKQTPGFQKSMDTYMKKFPSKMTQQKAIYNVYRMMTKTGIRVSAIQPGVESTFFKDGQIVGVTADSPDGNTGGAAVSGGAVEAEPETEVPINQMAGNVVPYQITVSGSLNQIKKALDWISENKEHMSATNINLTYDSSTGKLSGSLDVNFYSVLGNGVPYEDPDIRGIVIGSKNIFGTVK